MVVPIIIKLLISLALIILINRITKNLPLALLGGSLSFSIWLGLGAVQTLTVITERVFSWNTAGLLALVSLVILLSMQMNETQMVHKLVSSIRSICSTRVSLAVIPAVIGLLPMPGGALFSAPLLDNFDDLEGINPQTKTRINYWFRHVWEYSWPLYPGIIVACNIAGIELWQILLFGMPISFIAIGMGSLFFLSKISVETRKKQATQSFSARPFLPLLTVIVLYGAIQLFLPAVGKINQYLPMVIGLIVAITMLALQKPLSTKQWLSMLISPKIGKMLLIILMVQVRGFHRNRSFRNLRR
jgi:integral membrane protein (TIGR00529 family)